MDESPRPPDETPFSELTVQLLEQAAALAGERVSAPIRAAGAFAARALTLGGLALGFLLLGLVFLGVAIGHALRLAPEESRWWICLLAAVAFLATGAVLAILVPKGRKSEATARGEEDAQRQ